MTELVSVALGMVCLFVALRVWSTQRRLRIHALTHTTQEFVAAAQEVFSDPLIPNDEKERLKKFAPFIDNIKMARHVANSFGTATDVGDRNWLNELPEEQRSKVLKALFLFVIALSYTDDKAGEKIRDYILSSKIDQRVQPTLLAIQREFAAA